MFEPGQIVWAKIKGYPWWPSMLCQQISQIVSSEPYEQDKNGNNCEFLVNFIGENSHATLPSKKLSDFQKYFKEFSNQNRNKKLQESVKTACKILSGETSFEYESRKLEFLFINQKEKKISKKTKGESRSEEDFDFVSIISNKSKSSNNYFKSRVQEIYPDQSSIKKVKTSAFNETEPEKTPQLDELPSILNSPKKSLITLKPFNHNTYSKVLNETKNSLIQNTNPEANMESLVSSTCKLKEFLFQSIQQVIHKQGPMMDAILNYATKYYNEKESMSEKIKQYDNLLEDIKLKFYNEVILLLTKLFDPSTLLANLRSEYPKTFQQEELKKEIAAFDYSKETSCETKEHSNCALSDKSDLSSTRFDISELRRKVRWKLEKLLEKKFSMGNSISSPTSSEIEQKIFSACAKNTSGYIKSTLIMFRSIKKGLLQFTTLQKTKDFNIASLGLLHVIPELKLALNENEESTSKESKENSLGVIK